MKTLYSTIATVSGGREGHGRTDDGKLDLDLSIPKELGGPGGDGTNPEQLFAVAYGACFLGAVKFVAAQQKKDVGDASVVSHVSILDDNGFKLAVQLNCNLPGVSHEEAEAITSEAHLKVCPYSKATRNNIDVTIVVE